MKPFPPLSADLIAALEERFKDQCPDIKDTDREVWFKTGQVSVIRFLKATLERQSKNIMET